MGLPANERTFLIALCTICFLLISNHTNAQSVYEVCVDKYSCLDDQITFDGENGTYDTIGVRGYSGLSSAKSSIISNYYKVSTQIDTSYGAYEAKFLKGNRVHCYGDHSCANIQTNITANASIDCRAPFACMGNRLISEEGNIDCRGDGACRNSILQTYTNIAARGAYSVMNSVIYPMYNEAYRAPWAAVYLFSYFAGYNGTMICNSSSDICRVYCYGNGCTNFIFECSNGASCITYYCNDTLNVACPIWTNSSEETLEAQASIEELSEEEESDYGYGVWYDMEYYSRVEDAKCNNESLSPITFDNYTYWQGGLGKDINTTLDNSNICCRAAGSCRSATRLITYGNNSNVICSASTACREVDLIEAQEGSIYCMGSDVCLTNTMTAKYVVYCSGYISCLHGTIVNTKHVYCAGGYAVCERTTIKGCENIYVIAGWYQNFKNATVISDDVTTRTGNSMNLYLMTDLVAYWARIYCNESDVCNIYCATADSCNDGMCLIF